MAFAGSCSNLMYTLLMKTVLCVGYCVSGIVYCELYCEFCRPTSPGVARAVITESVVVQLLNNSGSCLAEIILSRVEFSTAYVDRLSSNFVLIHPDSTAFSLHFRGR